MLPMTHTLAYLGPHFVTVSNDTLYWGKENMADLFIDLVNRSFGAESDYASAENANGFAAVVCEQVSLTVVGLSGRSAASPVGDGVMTWLWVSRPDCRGS